MWGTADNWTFECTQDHNGEWHFRLPIDKTDGQYAAEVHVLDEAGKTDCWVGMLYINHGNACLHLEKPRYFMNTECQSYSIQPEPQTCVMKYERRCSYA